MNTPSHLIITGALRRRFTRLSIPLRAVLWGSVAPDLPLYLLSLGGFLYYPLVAGMSLGEAGELMYSQLFYTDPVWVTLHNFLHAPLVLTAGIGLASLGTGRKRRWLRWFFLSCALHTGIDIVTHHNDGPLLLFPLDWSLRFSSPISYWDPDHYGGIFTISELTLDAVLLSYWLLPHVQRWWRGRRNGS